MKKFKEFVALNEKVKIKIGSTTGGEWKENAEITARELSSGLVISIEPTKIEVLVSTSSELDIDVLMSNNDKIEYRSYIDDSPYTKPGSTQSFIRIKLNGKTIYEDKGADYADAPSDEIIRAYEEAYKLRSK